MTTETNVQTLNSYKTSVPAMDAEGIWIREGDPMMCCYKVARLHVCKLGLPGSRIEKWGHNHGLQSSFLRFHRQQLCWIDSWFGLRVSDVDGMNDGWIDEKVERRRRKEEEMGIGRGGRRRSRVLDNVACALSTDGLAECTAGLVFASSDESNPFFT